MEHSIEEIAALLHIHQQAHANGGLGNIANAALARLVQINKNMPVAALLQEEPEPETLAEAETVAEPDPPAPPADAPKAEPEAPQTEPATDRRV